MTELIWEGKYVDGKRQGPVRVALPFQTIETVNESSADRQRSLELFGTGRETVWRNRLIWGDKKYVLPSLLAEFAGKVKLIYIDPPFDTGADFSYTAILPPKNADSDDDAVEFLKQPSIIEQKAYRDTWGRGINSYLQWFYETASLLRELLAEDGSIYVHLDQNVVHHAKLIMDDVFGLDCFLNHIIWSYRRWPSVSAKYQSMHDDLLFYAKNPAAKRVFHTEYEAPSESYLKRFKGKTQVLDPESGTRKLTVDAPTKGLPLRDVWELSIVAGFKAERTGYPTQKPETLLERIIDVSSNEGDLVLDCFVGGGTTATVAEKLKRRWIACDLGRFAIHTTRKQLLRVPNLQPFAVQNLGKYERQAWQTAEFVALGNESVLEQQRERDSAYRKFILDLYHANAVSGYSWLHGVKSGRMVHVGAVDAPVTLTDVKSIAREAWKAATGSGAIRKTVVDVLGWEFAFELNETARQVAAESRVDVTFKKIPREVLEKKAVEQGDVKFFELGALSVEPKQKGEELSIKLTDFVIPIDDVPEEARKAIKHWSQMIDYWAVDWDFKDDTFHNQWQSYRTRKDTHIELATKYEYAKPGNYRVLVKVIDILGNDTTKTLDIKVK